MSQYRLQQQLLCISLHMKYELKMKSRMWTKRRRKIQRGWE